MNEKQPTNKNTVKKRSATHLIRLSLIIYVRMRGALNGLYDEKQISRFELSVSLVMAFNRCLWLCRVKIYQKKTRNSYQ